MSGQVPEVAHQWVDAKEEPFVIRRGEDGDPLLSGDGKNAVPARNWRWPVESLVREILRLVAENAELKAEPDFVALVARAVRDEGARIRREMLALIQRAERERMDDRSPLTFNEDDLRAEIDRIVPEEG